MKEWHLHTKYQDEMIPAVLVRQWPSLLTRGIVHVWWLLWPTTLQVGSTKIRFGVPCHESARVKFPKFKVASQPSPLETLSCIQASPGA